MSDISEWVSLGEAAEIIGVHPATIRNWAERGELPFRRTPGGHRRFRRSDLQSWLNSNRITQPTEAQMVVQSALGRARLEIGDRGKITDLDWYTKLNGEARDIMPAGITPDGIADPASGESNQRLRTQNCPRNRASLWRSPQQARADPLASIRGLFLFCRFFARGCNPDGNLECFTFTWHMGRYAAPDE